MGLSNIIHLFFLAFKGHRVEKDFDIAKEAGGVLRAIPKKFNATVTDHYLEIHLFWAGKGTCCIPKAGYYGPLIAGLHASASNVSAHTRVSYQLL